VKNEKKKAVKKVFWPVFMPEPSVSLPTPAFGVFPN
jgi:hypothetical protein